MINRCSGRTIAQCGVERFKGLLPSVTVGNRAVLEGRRVKGIRTLVAARKDIDLLTAAILPALPLALEETLLVSAIVNQIEMLFLLYRVGGGQPQVRLKGSPPAQSIDRGVYSGGQKG